MKKSIFNKSFYTLTIMKIFIFWLFFILINEINSFRFRQKNVFIKNKIHHTPSESEPYPSLNISMNLCSDNVTHTAVYSGMMKMMYINIINPNEIMLNIQDSLYTEIDTHSVSTLDIYSFVISILLRLSYNTHKRNEIKYIHYNYQNKYTKERRRYFNIKRMSSMVFFILYTIFCRNIHYAE